MIEVNTRVLTLDGPGTVIGASDDGDSFIVRLDQKPENGNTDSMEYSRNEIMRLDEVGRAARQDNLDGE